MGFLWYYKTPTTYIFGQNIREIHGLGVFPHSHGLHGPDKGEVVGDNLAKLREMPSIPSDK